MLILTRRIKERIHIGDEIVITVLGKEGTHVRIGIDAPKDMKIWRSNDKERSKYSYPSFNTNDVF